MTSRKKAGFMLLMVMLFVFLTACGSKEEERTLQIQRLDKTMSIDSEIQLPYEVKLYEKATEACKNSIAVTQYGEKGTISCSFSTKGEEKFTGVTEGTVIESGEKTNGCKANHQVGDISLISLDIPKMEEEATIVYGVEISSLETGKLKLTLYFCMKIEVSEKPGNAEETKEIFQSNEGK